MLLRGFPTNVSNTGERRLFGTAYLYPGDVCRLVVVILLVVTPMFLEGGSIETKANG